MKGRANAVALILESDANRLQLFDHGCRGIEARLDLSGELLRGVADDGGPDLGISGAHFRGQRFDGGRVEPGQYGSGKGGRSQ